MDLLSNRLVSLCHVVHRLREDVDKLKILTIIDSPPKSHEATKISTAALHLKWTYAPFVHTYGVPVLVIQ